MVLKGVLVVAAIYFSQILPSAFSARHAGTSQGIRKDNEVPSYFPTTEPPVYLPVAYSHAGDPSELKVLKGHVCRLEIDEYNHLTCMEGSEDIDQTNTIGAGIAVLHRDAFRYHIRYCNKNCNKKRLLAFMTHESFSKKFSLAGILLSAERARPSYRIKTGILYGSADENHRRFVFADIHAELNPVRPGYYPIKYILVGERGTPNELNVQKGHICQLEEDSASGSLRCKEGSEVIDQTNTIGAGIAVLHEDAFRYRIRYCNKNCNKKPLLAFIAHESFRKKFSLTGIRLISEEERLYKFRVGYFRGCFDDQAVEYHLSGVYVRPPNKDYVEVLPGFYIWGTKCANGEPIVSTVTMDATKLAADNADQINCFKVELVGRRRHVEAKNGVALVLQKDSTVKVVKLRDVLPLSKKGTKVVAVLMGAIDAEKDVKSSTTLKKVKFTYRVDGGSHALVMGRRGRPVDHGILPTEMNYEQRCFASLIKQDEKAFLDVSYPQCDVETINNERQDEMHETFKSLQRNVSPETRAADIAGVFVRYGIKVVAFGYDDTLIEQDDGGPLNQQIGEHANMLLTACNEKKFSLWIASDRNGQYKSTEDGRLKPGYDVCPPPHIADNHVVSILHTEGLKTGLTCYWPAVVVKPDNPDKAALGTRLSGPAGIARVLGNSNITFLIKAVVNSPSSRRSGSKVMPPELARLGRQSSMILLLSEIIRRESIEPNQLVLIDSDKQAVEDAVVCGFTAIQVNPSDSPEAVAGIELFGLTVPNSEDVSGRTAIFGDSSS